MKYRSTGEVRRLRRHFLYRLWRRKPYNCPAGVGNTFPLWWLAPPPCPLGSVSLDSQSPTAPCESSSLATRWEACHWIRGSRGSPMNPVPLPPPLRGGTIKLRYAVSCLRKTAFQSFILPPEQGAVRRSRKGGGERSEPIRRMLFMPYNIESQSRNADFISIARRAIHNPRPEGPSNLRTLRTLGAKPRQPSRRRRVPKTLFERKPYYAV